MPYVTSVERLARQEGRLEGRHEGLSEGRDEACQALRAGILAQYRARWGEPPLQVLEKLNGVRDLNLLVELLGNLPDSPGGLLA